MEKLERLKELYALVDNRRDFHIAVANEFQLKASSVRTNWFGKRFEVPEKYGVIDRVLVFTEEYVENQPKEVVEDVE